MADNKITAFVKKEEKLGFETIKANDVKAAYRFKDFESLCVRSQKGIAKYLTKELKTLYGSDNVAKIEGNYIFAIGEVPVLLVAHIDTIHESLPKQFLYSKDYNLMASPEGIGGDDRCGVYAIMEIIKSRKCSVLFCYDEEIGCVGADNFSEHVEKGEKLKALFDDIKFIIEIDRRGSTDAVYYDLDNKEFEKFVTESSKGYFKTEYGTCSDISYIAPALGKAAVNLSAGYYNEHHKNEYVNISELKKTIEHAKLIIDKAKKLEAPFEYKERIYFKSKYNYGYYDDYYDEYDSYYGGYNSYFEDRKYYKENKDYTSKYSGEEEFEIAFEDYDGTFSLDFFYGMTEDEALGKFFKAHPKTTYNDVEYIDYSSNYRVTVDRCYYEGEETVNELYR